MMLAALLLLVATARADEVSYRDHLLPVLKNRCLLCHNPDQLKAGLDLSSFAALMNGGSGGAVVAAGDADGSRLFQVVSHQAEPFMPPNQPRIDDAELGVLRQWIEGGLLDQPGGRRQEAANHAVAVLVAATDDDAPAPAPTRLPKEPLEQTDRGAITCLAVSPRGTLAALGEAGQILLYDTGTLELVGILPFAEGVPMSLAFARGGTHLLAAGGRAAQSGQAVLIDVLTGERVIVVGDTLDQLLAADLSRDLGQIACGGPDRKVRRFATRDGSTLQTIDKHTDWVTAVSFSPDGVLLATADRGGNLFVWEAFSGQEYLLLETHPAAITAVAWRADSNLLASACEDGSVRVFDVNEGKRIAAFRAHPLGVLAVGFAADGRIVSAGRDRRVLVSDGGGKPLRAIDGLLDIATAAAFSSDGARVIGVDFSGAVSVWNSGDGALAGRLDACPPTLESRRSAAAAELARLDPLANDAADRLAAADAAARGPREQHLAAESARRAAQARLEAAAARLAEARLALEANERARADLDAGLLSASEHERAASKLLATAETAHATALARVDERDAEARHKQALLDPLATALAAIETSAAAAPADAALASLLAHTHDAVLAGRRAVAEAQVALADARDQAVVTQAKRDDRAAEHNRAAQDAALLRQRLVDLAAQRDQFMRSAAEAEAQLAPAAADTGAALQDEVRSREESLRREQLLAAARNAAAPLLAAREQATRDLARWEAEIVNMECIATQRAQRDAEARHRELVAGREAACAGLISAEARLNDLRWDSDLLAARAGYVRIGIARDRDHAATTAAARQQAMLDRDDGIRFRDATAAGLAPLRARAGAAPANPALLDAVAQADRLIAALTRDVQAQDDRIAAHDRLLAGLQRRIDAAEQALLAGADATPARTAALLEQVAAIDEAALALDAAHHAENEDAALLAAIGARLEQLEGSYQATLARAIGDASRSLAGPTATTEPAVAGTR